MLLFTGEVGSAVATEEFPPATDFRREAAEDIEKMKK
jgi:hypothetical protein